jgi:hypothetical protein
MAAPVTAPMRAEINDEVLLVVLERDYMNHDFHGWEVADAYDWKRMRTELDTSPDKEQISTKLAGFAEATSSKTPAAILKALIKNKALPIAGTDFAAHGACTGSYWWPASKEKRLLCVIAATDFNASTRISPEVYYARDKLLQLVAAKQSNVQALQDELDALVQTKAAEEAAFNRRIAELQVGSDAQAALQAEAALKAAEFEAAQSQLQAALAKASKDNKAAWTKAGLGKDCTGVLPDTTLEYATITRAQLECLVQKFALSGNAAFLSYMSALKSNPSSDTVLQTVMQKMEIDGKLRIGGKLLIHIPIKDGMNAPFHAEFRKAVPTVLQRQVADSKSEIGVEEAKGGRETEAGESKSEGGVEETKTKDDSAGTPSPEITVTVIKNAFMRAVVAATGLSYDDFCEYMFWYMNAKATTPASEITAQINAWQESIGKQYGFVDQIALLPGKITAYRAEHFKGLRAGGKEFEDAEKRASQYLNKITQDAREYFEKELRERGEFDAAANTIATQFMTAVKNKLYPETASAADVDAQKAAALARSATLGLKNGALVGFKFNATAGTAPRPAAKAPIVKLTAAQALHAGVVAAAEKSARAKEQRLMGFEDARESPPAGNRGSYDARAAIEAKQKANIVQATPDSIFGKLRRTPPAPQQGPPAQAMPPPPWIRPPSPPSTPMPPPPAVAFPEEPPMPPPMPPNQGGRRKRRHALPYL